MEISHFGERFSARTGIQELMDDLGSALSSGDKSYMLGGGNPALIPEISRIWRERMKDILAAEGDFDRMLGYYDSPQGKGEFLVAMAALLRENYGWEVSERNIAVTNGSQNAFFFFLNMFSGSTRGGRRRRILFPLVPEYIGYADQSAEEGSFVSNLPLIRETGDHEFKYFIDFDSLQVSHDIGAICVSRPTNPTGNVLTDAEITHLSELAAEHNIPLLIDNAYGTPFPHIIFEEVVPIWNEHVVMSMSLSKIGLPALRTGIVVARKEIVQAISSANAVMNLAIGGVGQALTLPLVRSGEILRLSREVVMPFYRQKSRQAIEWLHQALGNEVDYRIHRSEGSLFLWIWFKNLPIPTKELYRRLKRRSVFIIPGEYFFYGLSAPWEHREECIRLSYAQSDEVVREGIEIIADEVRSLIM
ncbi:MAG TPA: valine--pyruvate transaminase [Spirochaetia bacterium]|nr:valine--pyruvate transaminase [Spirochaetia bacterium]